MAGIAALEEQRVVTGPAIDESDRPVTVPDPEGLGLVLALVVWVLELEDEALAVSHGGEDERHVGFRERIAEHELPPLGARAESSVETVEPPPTVVSITQPFEGNRDLHPTRIAGRVSRAGPPDRRAPRDRPPPCDPREASRDR